MFSELDLIFVLILGVMFGVFIGFIPNGLSLKQVKEPTIASDKTNKILIANNILLKISLWKMIVGFVPKDETGCYCTDGSGFLSDAFCRLGIESNTIDEQMALWKIERLDKKLGEL